MSCPLTVNIAGYDPFESYAGVGIDCRHVDVPEHGRGYHHGRDRMDQPGGPGQLMQPDHRTGGDEDRASDHHGHEIYLLGGVELPLLGKDHFLADRREPHQRQPFQIVERPEPCALDIIEVHPVIAPSLDDDQRGEDEQANTRQPVGPGKDVAERSAGISIIHNNENERS